MSSTQLPGPFPSGTPPPSPPTYNSFNDTSTLLFGFLVSSLSIFAVFMVSALIWQRLVVRRRAIEAAMEVGPPLRSQGTHRPTTWDIWALPDKQLPQWLNVKPVAAQKCDFSANAPRTQLGTQQTTSFWRRRLVDKMPPEITYLFHRPAPQGFSAIPSDAGDMSWAGLLDGTDIQISLLISMPRAPQSAQEGKGQWFHELVFATKNVHYHNDLS